MDLFGADNIELSRKIMFISMISFPPLVLLLVFLHYLLTIQVYLRRQSRRREAIQPLSHTEPPTIGLDSDLIAILPVFFVKPEPQEEGVTVMECAVCLSGLQEKEIARLLPNCNHS